MKFCHPAIFPACFSVAVLVLAVSSSSVASAQNSSSSSSSSKSHSSPQAKTPKSALDAGSVSAGVYRNSGFGFSCKIPAGWVLRTEEMNATDSQETRQPGKSSTAAESGRVLLAAFSRPPEARAEEVNGSILIAAESVSTYPGLTDAAQYFGPVMEIAKAQGLAMDDEPYEFLVGTKKLVRGDFQKDVGSRVMRQSTLVMLARGYAISFTFIGGTEDEVDELMEGLSFGADGKSVK
jgi:hypothetical protein